MSDTAFVQSIVAALRSVLPESVVPDGLHEPEFGGNEWRYVKECLDSGWVSSAGAYVDRFERLLEEYTGVSNAIAVVNGTAALHLCLNLVNVRPGDEVVVPTLTFVATANAVAYCGATPHFCDSSESTLGIDVDKLTTHLRKSSEVRRDGCFNRHTGARIAAIVAMHTFGHPVDLDPLVALCEDFGIPLIEDAAEALGSLYHGTHTGHFGRVSALSFNGNKVVTTGGGGAVVTNDAALGKLAKHLSTTARTAHRWSFMHDAVGYNYRMPNINAALGCAQIEQLDDFLVRKRSLAYAYARAFEGIDEVEVVRETPGTRSNYWLNAIRLAPARAHLRDDVLEQTNNSGIPTRPVWTLMHRLPMYRSCPRMDLTVAEQLAQQIVNLPSSAALGRR